MRDAGLWALMQRVENYLYCAERLESVSAKAPDGAGDLLAEIAARWRAEAEQLSAASAASAPAPKRAADAERTSNRLRLRA